MQYDSGTAKFTIALKNKSYYYMVQPKMKVLFDFVISCGQSSLIIGFLLFFLKLIQWVNMAHSFLVCVKSVTFYNFRLTCIVLHKAVKDFSKTHFFKNGKTCNFNLGSHFRPTLKIS